MASITILQDEVADIERLLSMARTPRVQRELDALLYKFKQELSLTFLDNSNNGSSASLHLRRPLQQERLLEQDAQSKSGTLHNSVCSTKDDDISVIDHAAKNHAPPASRSDARLRFAAFDATSSKSSPLITVDVDNGKILHARAAVKQEDATIFESAALKKYNNPVPDDETKQPRKKTSVFFKEFAALDNIDDISGGESPYVKPELTDMDEKPMKVAGEHVVVKLEHAADQEKHFNDRLTLSSRSTAPLRPPSQANVCDDYSSVNFDDIFGENKQAQETRKTQSSAHNSSVHDGFTQIQTAMSFLNDTDSNGTTTVVAALSNPDQNDSSAYSSSFQNDYPDADCYYDQDMTMSHANHYGKEERPLAAVATCTRMPYRPSNDNDPVDAGTTAPYNKNTTGKAYANTTPPRKAVHRRFHRESSQDELADSIIECDSPVKILPASSSHATTLLRSNLAAPFGGGIRSGTSSFQPASRLHAGNGSPNISAGSASSYTTRTVEPYEIGSNAVPSFSRFAVPAVPNRSNYSIAATSDDVEVIDEHLSSTTQRRYSGPAFEIIESSSSTSVAAPGAHAKPAPTQSAGVAAGGIVPPRNLPTMYTNIGTTYFHGKVQHDGNNPLLKRTNHKFSDAVENTFRITFGFKRHQFRTNQLEVINAALLGYDCFVLKPTGAGKSLCYQLPACVQPGVTVVISPLRSLIQDQTNKLRSLHVRCAALTSDCLKSEENQIYADLECAEPKIKLLYITPEKLSASSRLQNVLQDALYPRGLLQRIVIDEAHCVSSWGHDFRPDYRKIKIVREWFGNGASVPLMALTATANPRVRGDILQQLGMNPTSTKWFLQSFNRPNLRYEVRKKKSPRECQQDLVELMHSSEFANQSGIVYCLSRNDCDEMAAWLVQNDIKAISYHAGLNDKDRARAQSMWSNDEVKVACATIAFGMGIDKYDVRFVVHHSLPKSVEGYYQESGRAGRDGLPALCLLYYSWADVTRLRKLIAHEGENGSFGGRGKKSFASDGGGGYDSSPGPSSASARATKNQHFANLKSVIGYCESTMECRRTQLLDYFGEIYNSENCGAAGSGAGAASLLPTICDNCESRRAAEASGQARIMQDFTEDAKVIAKFILNDIGMCVSNGRNRRITLIQLAEAFKGPPPAKKGKKVAGDSARAHAINAKQAFFSKLSIFSKGAHHSRHDIDRLLRLMIAKNILEESIDFSMQYAVAYVHGAPAISELMAGKLKIILDVMPKSSTATVRDEPSKSSTNASVRGRPKKNSAGVSAEYAANRAAMVEKCKSELRMALAQNKSARVKAGDDSYASAYDACPPDTLARIAHIMPRDEQQFLAVAGVSKFLYDQVGEAFLAITARYADLCSQRGFELGSEKDYNVEDPQEARAHIEEVEDNRPRKRVGRPAAEATVVEEDHGCVGDEDYELHPSLFGDMDSFANEKSEGSEEDDDDNEEGVTQSPHFSGGARPKRMPTMRCVRGGAGKPTFQPASSLNGGSSCGGGYARQKRAAPSNRGGHSTGRGASSANKRYKPGGYKAPGKSTSTSTSSINSTAYTRNYAASDYTKNAGEPSSSSVLSSFSGGNQTASNYARGGGAASALDLMPTPSGVVRPPVRKKLC